MTASHSGAEHGDASVARGGEILRTEAGSEVHGLDLPGGADHDEMGVFVEPPDRVIGMTGALDHYVWRTRPEGERSRHGDTDLVMYSLRKYLRLAADGNPSVLLPMFAPAASVLASSALGEELRAMGTAFLTRRAIDRFVGYLDGQVRRLEGNDAKLPNRPELVAAYGYDVKYASHALRLGLQGLEIAERGTLTLPMPETEREQVLRVKTGRGGDLEQVLAEVATVREAIVAARERSGLPEAPDLDRLSAWSVDAHRRHWRERGL